MNFEKYIKNNKIVKASTFELVPVGRTREFIEKHNTLQEDAVRKENAGIVKIIADAFIKDFLKEFGHGISYDWNKLYAIVTMGTTDEIKSESEKFKELIAKEATKALNDYINFFLKANGYNEKVIKRDTSDFVDVALDMYCYVNKEFDKPLYHDAIKSMCGAFSSLFKKYNISYEKIIGGTKAGSIAFRTYENYNTFCLNKKTVERILTVFPDLVIDEMFVNTDDTSFCMSQEGIDKYNSFIGDLYNADGELIRRGINFKINEWNQNNKDKKERLPLLIKMKKQILGDAQKSFTVDTISTKQEFVEMMEKIRSLDASVTEETRKIVSNLKNGYYINKSVFVTRAGCANLAHKFAKWNCFEVIKKEAMEDKIKADFFAEKGRVKKALTQKDEKEVEKALSNMTCSIAELNDMAGTQTSQTMETIIFGMFEKAVSKKEEAYRELKQLSMWETDNKPTYNDNEFIQKYLDAVLNVCHITKLFCINDSALEMDMVFVEDVDNISASKKDIVKGYNMVRNYLTKKNENEAKAKRIQLCFGRPAHFEQKWDNKQAGKFGNVDAGLIEYNGLYYFIVPASKTTRKLNFPLSDMPHEGENYNYLSTKKTSGLVKCLPKMTFKSAEAYRHYETTDSEFDIPVGDLTITVSKKMFDDYNNKTFRESKEELVKLIDFGKEFIAKSPIYTPYDFSGLKPSEEYANYNDFCNEVDSIAFRVNRLYVSKKLVDEAVEDGNLYMFMINSQDMYKSHDKKQNITSKRFNAIMNAMFTADNTIIINNAPTNYYRPAIIEAEDKHPVGSMLVNKLTTDGKTIPSEIYLELCAFYNGKKNTLSPQASAYNEKVSVKKSTFAHIKDKHYTEEKFSITSTYTINKSLTKATSVYELNEQVKEDIRNNGCNVMSIIRGIDNLLYYCIVDENGNKIEAGNLNAVGGADFYEKLTVLSSQRYIDAKNWKYEKKVAELKDTYLGQVCRKIVKIALENNAVISIDKISENIKNKYSAFDNRVYKKFEAKLTSALANYYNTELADNEVGGSLNPLQLAVEGADTMQNGILFHVSETSIRNICMASGYINLLNTFNITTIKQKLQFLNNISRIYYDETKDVFVFEFTWEKLGCSLKNDEIKLYNGMDKVWKVNTRLTRYRKNRETKKYEEVDGTQTLKNMIREHHPDMIDKDIDVTKLSSQEIQTVYEIFTLYANGYLPKLNADDESGYISPVTDWSNIGTMSYDEMTAYQLARKTLLTINKIKQGLDNKQLVVYRTEWLNSLLKK